MKKSYLMMAAAATMFAACTQSDFVNNVPETEQEIGFDNHVGKSTRAEITDEAALSTAGGFVVWGWKTPTANKQWAADKATQIFNAVNVHGSNNAWTYDNKKYWDKTSTYNFYAVAPYKPNPTSVTYSVTDPATGFVTISGVESALAANSDDFLVDRNGAKDVVGDYDGTHEKVNFDFNHIMSKVTLQLLCGGINAGDKITVTSLTMTGWNSNVATFTQKLAATPTVTNNIEEWTITDGTAGSATFSGSYELNSDAAVEVGSYIMVPQSVETLTFTLDYTITYAANSATEDFVAHSGELKSQTWGTDTHTIYTITVGPAPIEFEVNTVSGFTNKPKPQPGLDIQ